MKHLRHYAGWAAAAAALAALNALFWLQTIESLWVVAPALAAAALAAVWAAGVFRAAARNTAPEGRAVGGIHAVISSLVFLGILIVVYAFFQRWDAAWDLTREGRRELAPQTRQVLETLNREVRVYCFFLNVDDDLVRIARDKTTRFLDQCRRLTPLLEYEVLDPQIDRARLEGLNLSHASPQGTVVVKSGDRQRVITLTGGSPRLEERDFTNALINVLRQSEPKVCFLTGHQERDIFDDNERTGGSIFHNLLVRESYKVEKLQIRLSEPEVPVDCDILVINNPQGDLHPQEQRALQDYLDRGGRMLLLLDPWRGVETGTLGREVLRPWLEERYGIVVGSDIVVSDKQANLWVCELTGDDRPFEGIDAGFGEYRGSFHLGHPVTRGFEQVMVLQANRTVAAADPAPEGVIAVEILRTTPDFWAETDVNRVAETGTATRSPDERQGPLPLAVAATARTDHDPDRAGRPRDARIVVVGDSDFASNGQLIVPGNLNFLLNTVAWLSEQPELIAIRPTGKEATPLILGDGQRRAIAWGATLLPAQIVALAGVAVFLLRRRNQ